MKSISRFGKLGLYQANTYGDGSKTLVIDVYRKPTSVDTDAIRVFALKSNDVAPFITELIEMARVLGVTGGPDGT